MIEFFPIVELVGGPYDGEIRQMPPGVRNFLVFECPELLGSDVPATVEPRMCGRYVAGTGARRGKMLWSPVGGL